MEMVTRTRVENSNSNNERENMGEKTAAGAKGEDVQSEGRPGKLIATHGAYSNSPEQRDDAPDLGHARRNDDDEREDLLITTLQDHVSRERERRRESVSVEETAPSDIVGGKEDNYFEGEKHNSLQRMIMLFTRKPGFQELEESRA